MIHMNLINEIERSMRHKILNEVKKYFPQAKNLVSNSLFQTTSVKRGLYVAASPLIIDNSQVSLIDGFCLVSENYLDLAWKMRKNHHNIWELLQRTCPLEEHRVQSLHWLETALFFKESNSDPHVHVILPDYEYTKYVGRAFPRTDFEKEMAFMTNIASRMVCMNEHVFSSSHVDVHYYFSSIYEPQITKLACMLMGEEESFQKFLHAHGFETAYRSRIGDESFAEVALKFILWYVYLVMEGYKAGQFCLIMGDSDEAEAISRATIFLETLLPQIQLGHDYNVIIYRPLCGTVTTGPGRYRMYKSNVFLGQIELNARTLPTDMYRIIHTNETGAKIVPNSGRNAIVTDYSKCAIFRMAYHHPGVPDELLRNTVCQCEKVIQEDAGPDEKAQEMVNSVRQTKCTACAQRILGSLSDPMKTAASKINPSSRGVV